jgi:Ca-activated chloride channel family protein
MKRILFFSLLLLVMASAFTNFTRIIIGNITDDAGKPVIAQIFIKGTKTNAFSGSNGVFFLEIAGDKTVLVITAVGYETKEVVVGKEKELNIKLQAQKNTLQEAVVKGYSTKMQRDMTGSTVVIGGNPINAGNSLNAQSYSPALAGRVSGVAVTNLYGLQSSGIRLPSGVDAKYFDRDKMFNTEGYDHIIDNPFLGVADNPLSTFSIDVDAASYSNIRRILKSGRLPQEGAVRIEEMINYFSYEYAQPTGKDPFAVHTELAVCPWNKDHQLAFIGLQGKKMDASDLPPSNLTFLIDVSGSMASPDKLPLVKASLKLLVDQLRAKDNVSIVVYAGNAGLVLPPTEGDHKITIKEAIDRLEAGGSTAGGDGIKLAYNVAKKNFNASGNNRVILCTDGDFNVGLSSDDALEKLVEDERKSGVYLTVLGYGTGNYQDAKMQKLADKGNGNHAYIDGISEAKKVLINEFGGTLFTIAKDVKLQIEFNPAKVQGYRLIGYENRMLAKEDFNNDKKDAGELGSGHTVTAIYELIPPNVPMPDKTGVDSLRCQVQLQAITTTQKQQFSNEVMFVKLRYKQPESDASTLMSHALNGTPTAIDKASTNFRFATAVASFGMLLRNSQYKGNANYRYIQSLAAEAKGDDREGYRKEFLELVSIAAKISAAKETAARFDDDRWDE